MNLTIKQQVHFDYGRRQKVVVAGPKPESPAGCRIPRISRLMALAIRFERLLAEGQVQDMAELARLGHVSRARITQIMNLLHLAPDIQEEILHLPPIETGKGRISERNLRKITRELRWDKQRELWREFAK